ncbi:DoxX family protein [Sphingobacterium hungaricum]
MKISQLKLAEWFLRIALSAGFLSASADRFGLWPENRSVWGNWKNFIAYTQSLMPFIPEKLIPFFAISATVLEIGLGVFLLTTFKTNLVAKTSCALLLLFALAMTISVSLKAALDYSVFTSAAAAFALSIIVKKKVS